MHQSAGSAPVIQVLSATQARTRSSLYSLSASAQHPAGLAAHGFDAQAYSRFKYGDASMANRFGQAIARQFTQQHVQWQAWAQQGLLAVASSAFKSVPTAAFAIAAAAARQLNEWLETSPPIELGVIHIHRQDLFEVDYARLSAQDRQHLMQDCSYSLATALPPECRLLVIDDIRITGAHENKVWNCLAEHALAQVHFGYVATLDYLPQAHEADVEDRLNHCWMHSLSQLAQLMAADDYALNARACKFVLAQPADQELRQFLRQLSSLRLQELYQAIRLDGYDTRRSFGPAWQLMLDEVEERACTA